MLVNFNMLTKSKIAASREYLGFVTALSETSLKAQVVVPGVLVGSDDQLPWAQYVSTSGSSMSGKVWHPAVGSTVIVRFPAGDANHPVIVGSYNSSPEGFTPNKSHGWADAKGNKLVVNEEDDSFTLSLVSGVRVFVNSDGEAEITTSKLTVNSSGDIDLTAQGNVTISGTNVTTSATNVNKVEGGPVTEITGQIVTLN